MSLLELIPSMSAAPGRLPKSDGGARSSTAPASEARNGSIHDEQRWSELIDRKLAEWEQDPQLLDDEGVDAPSREIVRQAIALAEYLRNRRVPAPERVVPDANGGLIFRWLSDGVTESIEIADDGSMEYVRMKDNRFIASEPLTFPAPADCG